MKRLTTSSKTTIKEDGGVCFSLAAAMYKGDTRVVDVDIFVDEVKLKSWTSSGTTAEFERVELSATGKKIELRGDLDESQWLSIVEVGEVVKKKSARLNSIECGRLHSG